MAKNNFKKEIERKRKADPVTLRKHFATFEEALSALRKADEGINNIFITEEEDGKTVEDITSPLEAINLIVDDFSGYTPDLLGKSNIHVALDVTSNKLTYRIDKTLAFGWLIGYTVEDGHAVIHDVSAQITVYDPSSLRDLILELTGDNWEQLASRKPKE